MHKADNSEISNPIMINNSELKGQAHHKSIVNISKKIKRNTIEKLYEKLSLDAKREYYFNCIDLVKTSHGEGQVYTINVDDKIDELYEMYEISGRQPKDIQIKFARKFYEKCNQIESLKEVLYDDVVNNSLKAEDGISFLNSKFNLLLENDNLEEAKQLAMQRLLSKFKSERSDAYGFLIQNTDWLTNHVNSSLNLDMNENESTIYMGMAINRMECELNLKDCSVNSDFSFGYCRMIPETCGLNSNELFGMIMSGLEISIVEQYLNYLRSLPP